MRVTRKKLDKELQPYFGRANAIKTLFRYKWLTRIFNATLTRFLNGKNIKGLQCDETRIPSSDGKYQIRTRLYRPLEATGNLPAVVYFHGGGYLSGSPEQFHSMIEGFIQARPCVVIAPDYRKSYLQPYPAGFNDCYDTLLWAKKHSGEAGTSADSIIVAGHSAGGGLAAAVTLKARDTGDVSIAFQMPIYPMIDDQQPSDASRSIVAPVWDSGTNRVGWKAYLSNLRNTQAEIPAYAAPARNIDYSNFPPTITLVGSFDPFYQETCQYVEALKNDGVEVAFKTYEGGFHSFEIIAPKTKMGKAALDFTFGKYAEFYDRYTNNSKW